MSDTAVCLVIAIKDIIRQLMKENFNDVYIVYELMDIDLHQIIHSHQDLMDDHCRALSQYAYLSMHKVIAYYDCEVGNSNLREISVVDVREISVVNVREYFVFPLEDEQEPVHLMNPALAFYEVITQEDMAGMLPQFPK
ncbi:hypothetical protein Ddye_018271 [Dipteronia dyeriana]|uniref:Uncharacterized protein n=1 Tax=Dipteronia dyeriana TaxID=168575 RepID=A0AAD9UAA9_9ROSI|nr:hypothetical protein Ddye_018271 [Dipteronia dyeriana]